MYKSSGERRIDQKQRGFTLLELLVVIAIIGIISALVFVAFSEARKDGREGQRASQMQELLKAFELYYTEYGEYPDSGGSIVQLLDPPSGPDPGAELISSPYMNRVPEDPIYSAANGYLYCSGGDNGSFYLYINTEDDGDDDQWCHIERGIPDSDCQSATSDPRYNSSCEF